MRTAKTYDPLNDQTRTYDLDNPQDMARYLIRNPYTWPGGYELFLVMKDGGVLCSDCVRAEYANIYNTTGNDGWTPAGTTHSGEMGLGTFEELEEMGCDVEYCGHCGREVNTID